MLSKEHFLLDAKGKLLLLKPRTDYPEAWFQLHWCSFMEKYPEQVRTANSLDVFRQVFTVGLLISIPAQTNSTCKAVLENFYVFSIVILIFYHRV